MPMQLVVNEVYIIFDSFKMHDIQDNKEYEGSVTLFHNRALTSVLYDEAAQEFIKLMESENDTND